MADATLHQQIAETQKQIEELNAKAQALKEESRSADLETVKSLVKLHGFSATDLRSELKTRGTTKTTVKKAAPKSRSKK
jgi:hypothetical protein